MRTQLNRVRAYALANVYPLLLISLVAWVTEFLHFARFGFYEDDWAFSGGPFGWDLRTWFEITKSATLYYSVGRPIQTALGYSMGYLGKLTNSFEFLYIVCFGMVVTSLALAYAVLRFRFPQSVSLLAVVLFAVSPLHTLHQFLNGQFSFAPAFIFLFAGTLFFLNNRFLPAYVLALLSLLTYESIFMLFLAAPLLGRGTIANIIRSRRSSIHWIVCCALFGIDYCLRLLTGESRVASLSGHGNLLLPALNYTFFYTFGSFRSYFESAKAAIRNASLEGWCYAIVLSVILGSYLAFTLPRIPVRGCEASRARALGSFRRARVLSRAVGAAIPAVLLLLLGYSLAYFMAGPPLGIYTRTLFLTGRLTKVSVAASFGSSLLIAVTLSTLLSLCRHSNLRIAVLVLTSAIFGTFFLYGFVVQDSYESSWAEQRSRLAQVLRITPDVQADSTIILKLPSKDQSAFGGGKRPFSVWYSDYFVTNSTSLLYRRDQQLPAICVVHSDDWKTSLKSSAGKLSWPAAGFPGEDAVCDAPLKPGRFIVLSETASGLVERSYAPIIVNGSQIVQPRDMQVNATPYWNKLVPTGVLGLVLQPETLNSIGASSSPKTFPERRPSISQVMVSTAKNGAFTFDVTVRDASGAPDISSFYFLVQSSVNPVKACWIYYSPQAKVFKLASDSGSDWSDEMKLASGLLSNGQCSTSASGWKVDSGGDELKIQLPIRFKPGFCGLKKMYVFSTSADNSTNGWQERGTLQLPCS